MIQISAKTWKKLINFYTEFIFTHFLSLFPRCVLLRSLCHHHLCQCRSGGDRKSDASLPICLQTKLHSSGLPVSSAVHHREPSLHRKPLPSGVCPQILPVQRCSTQLLFSHLHSGRKSISRELGCVWWLLGRRGWLVGKKTMLIINPWKRFSFEELCFYVTS